MNIGYLPPKAEMQLEDLFIAVYCFVEESYRQLVGDPSTLRQSNNGHPAFTDAEIITIALVGASYREKTPNAPGMARWTRAGVFSSPGCATAPAMAAGCVCCACRWPICSSRCVFWWAPAWIAIASSIAFR